MASPPTFSSFPDIPQPTESSSGAGPSTAVAPPSFPSFPEIKASKRRSHWRSTSPPNEEGRSSKRRSHARREEEEDSRRSSGRHQENRHNTSRHGRARREERSQYGNDSRKDTVKKEHHESTRDRSAERRYKEERRRREREDAERLIRGEEKRSRKDKDDGRDGKKRDDKWDKGEDDGTPWYESMGKVKAEYEEPRDPSSSKAFFTDTAGDRDILRYGSTSSNSTPKFYRDGKNRILGLSERLRIVYSRERTQKGVEVAPMGRPYIPRYSSRHVQPSAAQLLRRILLRPSDGADTFDPSSRFIAFDVKPPRNETDAASYRNIYHAEAEDEDDLIALQSIVGSYSTLEQEVRRRTTEIERHLRAHPEDVQVWIEYSKLHLRLSQETDRTTGLVDPATLPTTRARAEVTLSILSRALDATEGNGWSTKLHLAYLRAAEAFWPAEKVTGRWKNVLSELGERGGQEIEEGMMEVWLGYIAWREGQGFGKEEGKSGGVDEVVDVYVECLGKLQGGAIAGSDLQAREENMVYLFLRACLFLKQAGFAERAFAAFQALMEITFFKPDHLRRQPSPADRAKWFDAVLSEFETFWDSEASRIGETGARGWRSTTDVISSPPTTEDSFKHASSDPFERWLEAEKHAESTCAFPGRATDLDSATEDDPFHVVLFSDIQPFLFPVLNAEVRLQLIYAYFTFLGLPYAPPGVPSTAPASNDPHLRWQLMYNDMGRRMFWPRAENTKRIAWQTVGGEAMQPERSRGLENPFQCPVKCWLQDRGTMFGRPASWFRDLEAMDLSVVTASVVRNAFALLRPLVPDPSFTLAAFAFEAAVSPKGAVKMARTILADDRENFLLWDGYARLERQRGNTAAARIVYVTALQAGRVSRTGSIKPEDEMDLWASWAEMELESGNDAECLEVVVMAAGVGEDGLAGLGDPGRVAPAPTSIAMLKAKQYYTSLSERLSSSELILVTLFTYFSKGIESVRGFCLKRFASSPSSSPEAEELLQLLVRLLYFHTSRHPAPAPLIRDVLEIALASFPNNTIFLSIYLFGELGGRVYGRIQRFISESTTRAEGSGIVSHLWAVWAEGVSAHRTFWDKGGGGAERVRTALDKGINSATGRYSAPLWMLYIEFEILMGRFQTAKQLCYRAVSSLGGCKCLYLLPFAPSLRPHFTPRELKDWAELMIERGIRTLIPFEQFFLTDEGEVEPVIALPEDEELEDDELQFLSERQAMKPY
ncbi:hypothetical protein IAR55_001292 [Kwoniella newhampshirensis]|uniref:Uncharacterized protein n=1 Tax=Kwoniella newhampshirensis TaxID=1651941 RepID=A0AAW0Z5F9_9TREE